MTENKIKINELVAGLGMCYSRIKELNNMLLNEKEELKQARYDIKHLEDPKRSDKLSDDTYKKLCEVTFNMNTQGLSKKIDDTRREIKRIKNEIKKQADGMNLIIEFIKENSKEGYKLLLDYNIISECQLIQQSIH